MADDFVDAIIGDKRGDANVIAAEGANQREKIRNGIIRLRRDLWRVESELKTLEARTLVNIDADRLKPEFSKMFDGLVKVLEDFYGLSLSAFGADLTVQVAKDFGRRFEYLKKMAGG